MFSPTVSSSSSMSFRFFSASSSSLQSLLGRGLKLLHVLADSLELLFDVLQVLLSQLSPLDGSLQLSLLHAKLPAQLVQLLLVVRGHLDGGPQVLVQLLNGDLIVEA